MRVLLKFSIDATPDAAWRALHAPAVLAELVSPLVRMRAISPQPTSWEPGDDTVVALLSAIGVPLGEQLIQVSELERVSAGTRVRIFRDSGMPLTGPLASLRVWDHRMAVSAIAGAPGRALWRDQLTIAGPTAPALWPALWAFWQWRELRIRALAHTWSYEPEAASAR